MDRVDGALKERWLPICVGSLNAEVGECNTSSERVTRTAERIFVADVDVLCMDLDVV